MFPRIPSFIRRFIAVAGFLVLVTSFILLHKAEETSPTIDYYKHNAIRGSIHGSPNSSTSTGTNHSFQYIHNPQRVCQNISLIIYVHSAPHNLLKRQTIRQTWGCKSLLKKFQAAIVFIMGSVTDSNVMSRVTWESNTYKDIIQEDYVDAYRNLTHKAVGALKWLTEFCDKVQYILKTDDDIFVNIFKVVTKLDQTSVDAHSITPSQRTRMLMCNQWLKMKVVRDPKSKWYISKTDFPMPFFKPYCSGSAFIFTSDVARELYAVSKRTDFFWVDDYYLTGILPDKLRLSHTRLNEAYVLNPNVVMDKFMRDLNSTRVLMFFHVNKSNKIYLMWKAIQEVFHNPVSQWETTTHILS